MPRSSKPPDSCKLGGPKWPGILQFSPVVSFPAVFGPVTQCTLCLVSEKATAINDGCKGDYIYCHFSVRGKVSHFDCT